MLPFDNTITDKNLKNLCEQVVIWFARQRNSNWLVMKGHILLPKPTKPFFDVNCEISDGFAKITVTGQNTRVEFLCNQVVASSFRSGQIEFLIFDDQGVKVKRAAIASFSPSYQRILGLFPPGSRFPYSELYDKIRRKDGNPQAHARRRWKELKYNYGFDVDFDTAQSLYTRGNSEVPINDPVIRPKDDGLAKEFLESLVSVSKQENDDTLAHCAACGVRVAFKKDIENEEFDEEYEDLGLIDHRRPVFQGGDDQVINLQIFCQTCNNRKNSICRKCPYEFKCDTCVWAFPEKFLDRRIIIHLDPELIRNLKHRFGDDLERAIVGILEEMMLSIDE